MSAPTPTVDLEHIERVRNEAKKNPIFQKPGANYKLICPACQKPNSMITHCSGCGFALSEWDIQQVPDNIFWDVVLDKETGNKVVYRSKDIVVIDDKFATSAHHIDVIPTILIPDITHLTAEHIPLLEKMYTVGVEVLKSRNIPLFKNLDLTEYLLLGYNFPVSVAQLHLHLILPPFNHDKIAVYPRWHSHSKVVDDLRKFGEVRPFEKHPDETEGKTEKDKALKIHNQILELLNGKKP
eukprot:TRINITY_DN5105_c0_g1_i1.p1 TRINITY_DN5105_c0_g1~~TRINITY_DN5105_c0_g1_i1.p1  ORF type:complete len:239 (+),score=34.75 TRINITY_DN5105_c0_g1_i1:89-805(+)